MRPWVRAPRTPWSSALAPALTPVQEQTAHRTWPAPDSDWAMAQSWHDLLFAHWPVPEDELRERVPPELPLDTWDGRAWLSVVPFRMSGVRLARTPAIPGFSDFPELNVRTYVVLDGRPGVYFFSLDATNGLAVAGGRLWFGLPYFWARMRCDPEGPGIRYTSERLATNGAQAAVLVASYAPHGVPAAAEPGTIAHFLAERYCLYTVDGKRRVWRAEIQHPAWQLHEAEIELETHTMARPLGIDLPARPELAQFSRRQDVVLWAPERVR